MPGSEPKMSSSKKMNGELAEGFGAQISLNRSLMVFKLIHWKLSAKCWKSIGIALAK